MNADAELAPWVPPTVYVLAGGVGVSSLTVSAVELFLLATAVHFASAAAVALFVGLDLGAAAGAVIRVGAPAGSSMARAGRVTTWVLVAASAALNGISVLARAGAGQDSVGLLPAPVAVGVAIAIAVLFPVVAALMVELVLLVRTVPVARRHVVPEPAVAPRSAVRAAAPAAVLRSVPSSVEPVSAELERAEELWKSAVSETGTGPSSAALNSAVDADGLVEGRHLVQWAAELARGSPRTDAA